MALFFLLGARMTRLVLFFVFISLIISVLSLRYFQGHNPDTKSFNLAAYEKMQEEKQQAIQKYKVEQFNLEHGIAETVEEKESAPVAAVEVVLDSDEAKRGAKLFQSKCIMCHGKNGEGKKGQNAPKLAGQFDWYLEKQLQDFKAKIRVNKVMDPYVKPLNAQDLKDLAVYISKFPW